MKFRFMRALARTCVVLARGGLRWSDRPRFRTEVLVSQRNKRQYRTVPVGAKGEAFV